MLKRYKYRAYPTREQKEHLAQTFGCSRVVWNKYVEHYKTTGKYLSFKEASLQIGKLLKQDPEYSWLKDVSSIALQQKLKDATLAAFDKSKGTLSFKKYGECEHCKTVLDRDINAAMNILDLGIAYLKELQNPRKVGVSLESRETQTGTSLLKQLIV